MWALRECVKNLPKVAANPEDRVAKRQMLLAASFAGIGFGSAGVHLAHGMSYPVRALNTVDDAFSHPLPRFRG
jgi:hydroxyacid-oxoacid transhydrogenase